VTTAPDAAAELREARLAHWLGVLKAATRGHREVLTLERARELVGPVTGSETALDAMVQKALLLDLKARLTDEPRWQGVFKDQPEWKLLHNLLTVARVRELTRARVTKRTRSGKLGFDVSELAGTFYGRQTLDQLGISAARSVLTNEEFAQVQATLLASKLQLPTVVEPTTTEKFFQERPDQP
jgi:hypothetical protein